MDPCDLWTRRFGEVAISPEFCTCRREHTFIFWIEASQKETIERDHLSMYRLFFDRLSAGSESLKVEEVVAMAKSWFHLLKGGAHVRLGRRLQVSSRV